MGSVTVKKRDSQDRGFTLIELSIVLVVVGFLIASVLAAQSIIRSAQIQSVITQVEQFKTALAAFQIRYRTYPGDLERATSYWPNNSRYPGFKTANGDGDGRINGTLGTEDLLAWQHLNLAELIGGNYSGEKISNSDWFKIGENSPGSRIRGTGYWLRDNRPDPDRVGGGSARVYGRWGFYIQFAKESGDRFMGEVLTPAEAKSIDTKIDDGIADKGHVFGRDGRNVEAVGSGCTTDTWRYTTGNSDYILSNNDLLCMMNFWVHFES